MCPGRSAPSASPVDDVVAAEPLPPPRVLPPRSPGGAASLPVAASAPAETSASLADRRRSSGEPRALLSMLGADAHALWLRRRPIRGPGCEGVPRWEEMETSGKSRGALEVVIQSRVGGGDRSGKEKKKKKSPHSTGFSRVGRFRCGASECTVTAETDV